MTTHDVILRLVDLLLEEKDKNTQLLLLFQQGMLTKDKPNDRD